MLRPKKTAEIILRYHPAVQLNCRMDYGNQSRAVGRELEAEIEQAYPGELHRWRTQPAEVQMPSGKIAAGVGA